MGIHQELAEFMRGKIESGALMEGVKLPSQRALAKLWGTNLFSVKLATDKLVKLGLVTKRHGSGMYVSPTVEKLRRIGVYASTPPFSLADMAFFSVLRDFVCQRLEAREIDYEIWSDFRPENEHTEAPEKIKRAVISGDIQAVIGVMVNKIDHPWFERLPVKTVCVMGDPRPDLSKAVAILEQRECRRVGAIVPVSEGRNRNFWLEILKARGVKFRANRTRIIASKEYRTRQFAELGYRYAMELLTAPTPPDALIVYPDLAAHGVIQAILKLGINVPKDMTVVFHRNAELSYFCPFEACYVDTSISQIADELIAIITGNNYKTKE